MCHRWRDGWYIRHILDLYSNVDQEIVGDPVVGDQFWIEPVHYINIKIPCIDSLWVQRRLSQSFTISLSIATNPFHRVCYHISDVTVQADLYVNAAIRSIPCWRFLKLLTWKCKSNVNVLAVMPSADVTEPRLVTKLSQFQGSIRMVILMQNINNNNSTC